MKKNYLKPESQEVRIVLSTFMTASPQVGVSTNDDDAVDADGVDSRVYNNWDD